MVRSGRLIVHAPVQVLANDPMVAVREACARALPAFALCALVPGGDPSGRLAYEAVGAAYARLAEDRKIPPRKSLLRLTQVLVTRFAEADATLSPPASILRGWGLSTRTVVEVLATPLVTQSEYER